MEYGLTRGRAEELMPTARALAVMRVSNACLDLPVLSAGSFMYFFCISQCLPSRRPALGSAWFVFS